MMLEIPNDRPFAVERTGKLSVVVLRMGAVLKFYVEDPHKELAAVTLSPEEAIAIGGFLMSAGGPEGSRAECEIGGGTFVEGGSTVG